MTCWSEFKHFIQENELRNNNIHCDNNDKTYVDNDDDDYDDDAYDDDIHC